jgi:hypothetical protein
MIRKSQPAPREEKSFEERSPRALGVERNSQGLESRDRREGSQTLRVILLRSWASFLDVLSKGRMKKKGFQIRKRCRARKLKRGA